MLSYRRSTIYEYRYRFSLQHLLTNSTGNNHEFLHIIETLPTMYFFFFDIVFSLIRFYKSTRKLHFSRFNIVFDNCAIS